MRCRLALIAGFALWFSSACSQAERPTLLTGALYHGFTLVDAQAGELTPGAWIVVIGGEIVRYGDGTPPDGAYIAQIDLTGFYGLPRGRDAFAFLTDNPLTEMTHGRNTALVMTGGLLTEPAANLASLNEGVDTSSPEHS